LKENIDHLKQNLEDKASIAQSYKELYERASRDYAAVYRKNIELESRLTEDLEKNRKKFEEYLAQTKDLQTENFMLRDMNSKLRTEIEELKKEITELKKSLNVA
jgi:ketopantoate reductase